MGIVEYIRLSSPSFESARAVSRVIDVHKGVYISYSADLKSPLSGSKAGEAEFVFCLKYLSTWVENPKILNTMLRLQDELKDSGSRYLDSKEYIGIATKITRSLENQSICH